MTQMENIQNARCLNQKVANTTVTVCHYLVTFCRNDKNTTLVSCTTTSKPTNELVVMRHMEVRRAIANVPPSYIAAFLKDNEQLIVKCAKSFYKNDKSCNAKLLRKVGYIYEDVLSFCQVWATAFLAPRINTPFDPDKVDIKSLPRYLRQRFVELYKNCQKLASSCEIEGSAHRDDIELASVSQSTRQDEVTRSRVRALRPKAARQRIIEKLACKSHEEAIAILSEFDGDDSRTLSMKIKDTISKCSDKNPCPLCQAKKRIAVNSNIEYPPQQVGPMDVRNFIEEVLSVGKCTYGSLALPASKRRYRHDLITAARMLGLLSSNSDGSFSPTERAYKLCATDKESNQERELFRVYVSTSNTLKPYKLLDPLPLAPYTMTRCETTEDTSAAYYHYSWKLLESGLGASTAHRRTSTLIMWRRFLQNTIQKKVVVKEIVDKPFKIAEAPPLAPMVVEQMFKEQAKFRQLAF